CKGQPIAREPSADDAGLARPARAVATGLSPDEQCPRGRAERALGSKAWPSRWKGVDVRTGKCVLPHRWRMSSGPMRAAISRDRSAIEAHGCTHLERWARR